MIGLFEELTEQLNTDRHCFAVCFASRHYPKISVRRSLDLVVDDQTGHHEDVARFVRSNLRLEHSGLRDELVLEMEHKSTGIFILVMLVVSMLNKTCDTGQQDLLRRHLDAIPAELHNLLDNILVVNAVDEDHRFCPALQWILFACRPLTARQLHYAVLLGTGKRTAGSLSWCRANVSAQAVNDFVLSSSKGLAEIYQPSRASKVTEDPEGTVQFIHEFVRGSFAATALKSGPDPRQRLQRDLARSSCNMVRTIYSTRPASLVGYVQVIWRHLRLLEERPCRQRFPVIKIRHRGRDDPYGSRCWFRHPTHAVQ